MNDIWCYCMKCRRIIKVGEICYEIGGDADCSDCCKAVDTGNIPENYWKTIRVKH